MTIMNQSDPGTPRRNWARILVASALLFMMLCAFLTCVILAYVQLFLLDAREYRTFVDSLPAIVLAGPGFLGGIVMLATVVDFLRRRGFREACRWILIFFFLNVLLMTWYWVCELRCAMRSRSSE